MGGRGHAYVAVSGQAWFERLLHLGHVRWPINPAFLMAWTFFFSRYLSLPFRRASPKPPGPLSPGRPELHLRHGRALLRRGRRAGQHGGQPGAAGGPAQPAPAQAHHPLLPAPQRQPAVGSPAGPGRAAGAGGLQLVLRACNRGSTFASVDTPFTANPPLRASSHALILLSVSSSSPSALARRCARACRSCCATRSSPPASRTTRPRAGGRGAQGWRDSTISGGGLPAGGLHGSPRRGRT